jgi:ankyrin repeat protein
MQAFRAGCEELHNTRCCLAYLSCLGAEEPIARVKAQFPLAQYSAQYWIDHAKPAETAGDLAVLIEKGADVNAEGGYFGDAFYDASSEGHMHKEIIKMLIENGADIDARIASDTTL